MRRRALPSLIVSSAQRRAFRPPSLRSSTVSAPALERPFALGGASITMTSSRRGCGGRPPDTSARPDAREKGRVTAAELGRRKKRAPLELRAGPQTRVRGDSPTTPRSNLGPWRPSCWAAERDPGEAPVAREPSAAERPAAVFVARYSTWHNCTSETGPPCSIRLVLKGFGVITPLIMARIIAFLSPPIARESQVPCTRKAPYTVLRHCYSAGPCFTGCCTASALGPRPHASSPPPRPRAASVPARRRCLEGGSLNPPSRPATIRPPMVP